jgi:GT2 family glycosyltransferase
MEKPQEEGDRMTRQPRISVVVPNWDGRENLRVCLGSLQGLDYPSELVDVVVVDNGSEDGSTAMVRSAFPSVRLVTNDSNHGFAAACNEGARTASGAYVAFLNNDARVDSGWIGPLVDIMDREAEVAAVGSLVLDWSGRTIDFGRGGLTPIARGLQLDYGVPLARAPDRPAEQLFANGAAMLVRRDLFLEVGGFDERFFAYYEDVDLGWRYWVQGWRVLLHPASRVYHHHHGTSRRLRQEQIDFLLTRNAIASAIKNVETDTLARLLPILLLGEAARLAADFRLGNSFHVSGFASFAFHPPSSDSLATRSRHRLGSEAVRIYRRETAFRTRLARAAARMIDPSANLVSAKASAPIAALDEILWGWPELLARRASVQASRKRSDSEVSRLFGLEAQRRRPRGDALSPDDTREAVLSALEAAGLDWLLPRG